MNGWVGGCTDVDERLHEATGYMAGWVDVWMDAYMDGWVEREMSG